MSYIAMASFQCDTCGRIVKKEILWRPVTQVLVVELPEGWKGNGTNPVSTHSCSDRCAQEVSTRLRLEEDVKNAMDALGAAQRALSEFSMRVRFR